MSTKPIVAIDISTTGKSGGPYVNSYRIITSQLKRKYNFVMFEYNTNLGRGVSIKRILDIKKQLKTIKPDIVHFSGLQLSGFHVAVACKLAKAEKTIVTIHGFSGEAIYFNSFKKFFLTYFIEPFTLLLTNRFYCVSKYVASRPMVKLFNYKNEGVIYNFPPLQHKKDNSISIREELGVSKTDILAVSIGRITREKGYHILDEAILKLSNEQNLKFVIVGTGDYFDIMKKKLNDMIVEKKVFLLGYREDIQKILSNCDVFILPTLHETLSNALLEASVEKIPIVASNVGGVPEIIKHNYNGLLIPPGNITELVNSIIKLINNPNLSAQLSKNLSIKNNYLFSNKTIEKKIDNLYTRLLKQKR